MTVDEWIHKFKEAELSPYTESYGFLISRARPGVRSPYNDDKQMIHQAAKVCGFELVKLTQSLGTFRKPKKQ